MPIASTDLLYKFSIATAAAGNATPASVPGTSLGRYVSTTLVTDATIDNLFPDVTGTENVNSNVDYQCLFIHNNHATLTLQNAVVWLDSEVAGGATIAIAVDPTAASNVGSGGPQALQITNKNVAPAGVTFAAPTSKGAGISLGSLAPGQVRAVWIRRTAANTTTLNNDGVSLRVEGDSAA